jgi:ubiquitin C
MHILIEKSSERHLILEVEPADRIEHLKAMIQDEEGIPAAHQHLRFDGRVLRDGKTLQDYSIQEYSTIVLHSLAPVAPVRSGYGIRIFLNDESILVEPTDLVEVVRARVYHETGHPPDRFQLVWRGQELLDGKTLQDCGIHNEARIDVVAKFLF